MNRLALSSLFGLLAPFAPFLDTIEDWNPDPPEAGDVEECLADRCEADVFESPAEPVVAPTIYPVVDLEDAAAAVKYRNGKVKRTRYPRVDLSGRIVLIGLHQAGVERGESKWERTAHRVTCHRAIGPAGNRYRVHPLDTRIVCTNRVDRAPYQCIGIEVLGNFRGMPEGTPGGGKHYKPEVFGEGYLGLAQLIALRQEIQAVVDEVEAMGGVVVGILPHRTTGLNSRGRPNRPICCGFEIWSGAGEWAGAELGLRVPGPEWSLGGLPIHESWHGEYWPRCERFLA